MNQYGIDINTVDKFITKPGGKVLLSGPAFRLEKICVDAGQSVSLEGDTNFEATLFLEEGEAVIEGISIGAHEIVTLSPQKTWNIFVKKSAVAYLFFGPPDPASSYLKKTAPFDFREKYWGNIQTIVNKDYAGKRIFVRKGENASLEFHCRKSEGYFIHSGKLLLRLRAGRGEDKFFELEAGSSAFAPPGLMHQRGGLDDAVIIEISTRDEDSDSFLVEDGAHHPMPRLKALAEKPPLKTICFDIDGCICLQRDGDYENAAPNQKAIDLVNRFFDRGYKIVLFTSRFMRRTDGNRTEVYSRGYDFTKKQLQNWGVRYHELFMGKPYADVVVDDRAAFFRNDWDLIQKEIEKKLL